MTATEQMRRMLDELMGTGRNGEETEKKAHFTSPRVCKSFLLNCCPHEILSATRCDLGDCRKLHDVALRADYEAAAKEKDFNFHAEALEHLKTFLAESDRRTVAAKRRLAETQEALTAEEADRVNRIHVLVEKIGQNLAKAEQLGVEGNVEESLRIMEETDALRKEKFAAEQEYRNSIPASIAQQQKLRVCEVCSSFLGIYDNDRRLADHFNGKLHLGFITIREKVKELEDFFEQKQIGKLLDKEFKCARREGSYSENDANSKNGSPKHSHSKRHHHSTESSRSKRSRDRSRSRHRHRSRSRSRENYHYERRSKYSRR